MEHFFDFDSHGWLDPDLYPELYKDLTEEELARLCILRLVGFFSLIGIIGIVCVIIHFCKS